MKNLFLLSFILLSFASLSQTIPNYSKVNGNFYWTGSGYFEKGITIPSGSSPALGTLQMGKAGGLYLDTSGTSTDTGMYYYRQGYFVRVGSETLQKTTDFGNYTTNKVLSSTGFGSRDTLQYVDFWATTSKYMGGFQDRQFTSNAPYTNDTSTQIGFSHYGPLAGYANRYQTTPTSITAIGSDACRDCLLSGNVAFGNAALKRADSAFRNAAGGNGTLQFTRYGDENTTWGTFALEVQTVASGNVAIGSNAGRGNKLGTGMTVVGAYALVSNTTGVDSVQITNSGHGCSGTPTVTFSAPVTYNKDGSTINGTPGAAVATATGTAVMDGSGNVVRVTMTNQGAGYTTQLAPGVLNTATFSGGGCSVTPTATVVLISGDYNTGMGNNTLRGNTLGKYNTAIGYGAAYAGASGEAGNIDNYGLWIGYHASRHSTISATTRLSHASAIGANAKVRGDSMMIFGDSAAALRFGYGTTYVDRSAIAEFNTTTKGILLPKLTTTQMNAISTPATGLVVYNTDSTAAGGLMHYTGSAWAKVGGSGGGGGAGTVTSVAAGYGMNFTTITTTGSVIADSSVLMTKGTTQVVSGGKLYSANQVFNAQHATNRITLGSVPGQEQYPGIWMTSAVISLTNYAFLADISAGVNYVNGSNGSGLRVSNSDVLRATSTGVGIFATSTSAALHIIRTTEQQRTGYDASNYYSTTVSSTGGVTFNAVGSGSAFSFSDNISAPNLTSGTTTPTLTGVVNISSTSTSALKYVRYGNIVSYTGFFIVTPTAAGTANFDFSLPIASNFASSGDLFGTCNVTSVTGGDGQSGYGLAETTNDRGSVRFTAAANEANTIIISGHYIIN